MVGGLEMIDWDAVREHLIGIVGWHRGVGLRADRIYASNELVKMWAEHWQPDKDENQFFMLKDVMRERGWFWHGWEDESGANVQYWKPGEFHVAYGEDLMQANALAAAEVTGYEEG